MSLSVQTVLLLLLGAVVGLAVAFTVNNLEPVREFPGKNRLLWRIMGCLTLVPVVVAVLMDQGVTGQTRVLCWVAAGAIAVALLYDGGKLVSAVRVAKAKRRDPATDGIANSVGYEPELRIKLLAEIERQVEQRLKSAYGDQTLVNLEMHSAPDDVEGEARTSNVFLVPKAKQYVEKFKDSRVRLARSEETILDTFDDKAIAGNLLILGAPGSGKTTALLKLTKDLLGRAKETGREIPYIFELLAWPETQPDIASWLMAQLAFEHGIKETVSREWILAGQLLPLLDGLDELATGRRQKCIEKINEFVTGQLGRQVVVCCRTKVYEASAQKLDALNGALRIQPLEISQVQDYFEQINPEIWTALQDEAGLGALLKPIESGDEPALLQIPLFLQILAIAYQPDKTISSKAELLNAYVTRRLSLKIRKADRRLARRKEIIIKRAYKTVETEPTTETTELYLSWLARKLNENSIPNNFLIEQMQPSWLETKTQEWQYRLVGMLLVFVLLSSPVCLAIGITGSSASSSVFESFAIGSVFGCMVGFISITIGGVADKWEKITPVEIIQLPFSDTSQQRLISDFRQSLLFFLLFGSPLIFPLSLLSGSWFSTTQLGQTFGLLGCFFLGFLGTLILWFLLIFSQYLIEDMRKDLKVREKPNQGVFSSLKNSLYSTFLASVICLVLGIVIERFFDATSASAIGLVACLTFAPSFGFIVWGGLPAVQHSTLRFLLYRQGHIPHNYAQFLRYTTERRLTQQIGGRFRFIHRELLDHFAAMDSD